MKKVIVRKAVFNDYYLYTRPDGIRMARIWGIYDDEWDWRDLTEEEWEREMK